MEQYDERKINILVSTFSGLSLPKTLSVALPASTPLQEVHKTILSRLPPATNARYILSTPGHNDISASPQAPLSTLLSSQKDTLLTLRLSIPLCGGKGGFGSQLRAAGGRMSKRRKKDGDDNGSSRNLDGRRLRTINEAKALAEYLAIKPEMDKKAKEERRKRWAEIVEMSERKEEEIRNQGRNGKGRVSEQWLEDKDEAAERTREAVIRVMKAGTYSDLKFEKVLEEMEMEEQGREGGDADDDEDDEDGKDEDDEDESPGSSSMRDATTKPQAKTRQYFGFDDDDDEFMSDDEDEAESNTSVESEPVNQGKGKAVDKS